MHDFLRSLLVFYTDTVEYFTLVVGQFSLVWSLEYSISSCHLDPVFTSAYGNRKSITVWSKNERAEIRFVVACFW